MEVFLNFVWLLLFVPAWWMWRRNRQGFSSACCFLTLACALVLLFPVISATDDLQGASQAMEESSSTKRSLRQSSLATAGHSSGPPTFIAAALANPFLKQICLCILETSSFVFPEAPATSIVAGRAPPSLSLTHTS